MSTPYLSVIIPAFNEESRIAGTVHKLVAHLTSQPYAWDIIVVNDGSADRTAQVVEGLARGDTRVKLLNAPHAGKGAAVKRGMLAAQGEWRFLCDADLSMPPEHLARFFPGEGGKPRYDISIGSREAAGARRIGEPARRHIIGRLFNYLVRLIAVSGIQDTQCGFKLFSAQSATALFPHQRMPGFAFDVEVLMLARRAGFTIGEVPIDWLHNSDSRVSMLKGLTAFGDVLRIRCNSLLGRYRGLERRK